MDNVLRVEIIPLPGEAPSAFLLDDIRSLGIEGVTRVERHDLYFLSGALSGEQLAQLCQELLADPITQRAIWGPARGGVAESEGCVRLEVGLLPGVTDSVAASLLSRAQLLDVVGLRACASAASYLIYGNLSEDHAHTIARRLLCNGVVEYYEMGRLTPHVGVELPDRPLLAERVPVIRLTDDELARVSRDRLLSLDLAEMHAVQRYFAGLGREPTDVELESIAQTWSEHCGHKTFKGIIQYTEHTPQGPVHERIDSLIRTYLQSATQRINAPWVRSAFVDNAGIVDYARGPDGTRYEVSFKVETHNHPSALEPFGGANTGVGGVVRDIIGVSARPIANTDVLCFGPLDTPADKLPASVLHPRRIHNGVVRGVEDYGNKMGIPTVNGAILFDPGYIANPLVYCGCVGIAPVGAHPRSAQAGDLIVVLGGRTGRDGLHGATFSSIGLTDETGALSGGAVQIGNPITEKMTLDAILVARDERLYNAITDCGAGGLSSAVSEMGEHTGVQVQLDTVPLKYHGLQPWEIWLSEAQERMVLAVPPANEGRLRQICARYAVEMTVIGGFTKDARLNLRFGDSVVADISMGFLHKGIPRRTLRGGWRRPTHAEPTLAERPSGQGLGIALLGILAHPNIRSKEDVVRRYDHEVQGATLVKPFVGQHCSGPSDAAVVRPLELAGGGAAHGQAGIALGCGFNPSYGAIDPYAMAVSAVDEAVRNVVAVGADPHRIAILDNFCWGNPTLPDRMGGLVRACKGCYDAAVHYGVPFISGKDSLNNEYTDTTTGQQVSIPPSLLISSLGYVPDVQHVCTMDLKAAGSHLYLIGETRDELGGSYHYRLLGYVGNVAPGLAERGPDEAGALHTAIRQGLVLSCHDLSEGGLAVAAAEMMIAGRLGVELCLEAMSRHAGVPLREDCLLFSESNGRYLVEVALHRGAEFEHLMAGLPCARVGSVINETELVVSRPLGGEEIFTVTLDAAETAWRGHVPGTRAQTGCGT